MALTRSQDATNYIVSIADPRNGILWPIPTEHFNMSCFTRDDIAMPTRICFGLGGTRHLQLSIKASLTSHSPQKAQMSSPTLSEIFDYLADTYHLPKHPEEPWTNPLCFKVSVFAQFCDIILSIFTIAWRSCLDPKAACRLRTDR